MQIENKIHFVWIGNVLPEVYANEILSHLFNNIKYYKFFLWTDRPLENSKLFRNMDSTYKMIKTEKIDGRIILTYKKSYFRTGTLTFISTTTLYTACGSLYQRYEYAKDTERNYGRASDILRLGILRQEGGIYMDTDTESLKALPARITAKHGFMMGSRVSTGVGMNGMEGYREGFNNAVMAACANSDFINKAIKSVTFAFQFFDNKDWWPDILVNIQATQLARVEGDFASYQRYQDAMSSGTLNVTGPTKMKIFLYQYMFRTQAKDPYLFIYEKYVEEHENYNNFNVDDFNTLMNAFTTSITNPVFELEKNISEVNSYKFPMEYIRIRSDASWLRNRTD